MNGRVLALLILVIIVILIIVLLLYRNPHYSLYPYNYLVSNCTESQTFYHDNDLRCMFPQSVEFEAQWTEIRNEAISVLRLPNYNVWREFLTTDDEFWRGWNVFTMRLYGVDIEENMKRCPTVAKLLKAYPYINTAVFSILEPGKTLTPHYGPNKGVLRYHLGLIIPEGNCHLNVGDDIYYWKEGEGVLFDETYLHSAHNETNEVRVVLYLDIPRPMRYHWLQNLNERILDLIGASHHNQRAITTSSKSYN